ncbi:MAG: UDP-N-acetylglucosamine 2-epimerase, partial [Longimicrobiales bacterium]|nr:UDP-N-acetylglucosamine 2-epimerase [Longimicrobiales bacterium]
MTASSGADPDPRDAEEIRPRILALVGTRPEVIKMAPVVRALREREEEGEVDVRVAFSGQHTDLVDQALSTFSVELDYDLERGRGSDRASGAYESRLTREDRDLYDLAHGLLDGLRDVIRETRPDVVVVQGDTATVFFGALVTFLEGLELAHVEAGLRSGEKWAPFPEEMFRRMTDVVADHHFAPTPYAAESLRAEGIPSATIHVTGNTVVDAVRTAATVQEERGASNPELARILGGRNGPGGPGPEVQGRSDRSGSRDLVLLTAHRRESFGQPIRELFHTVRELADAVPGVEVLFP